MNAIPKKKTKRTRLLQPLASGRRPGEELPYEKVEDTGRDSSFIPTLKDTPFNGINSITTHL